MNFNRCKEGFVRVRQLKFRVGDLVRTPAGDIGKITHIGGLRDDYDRLIDINYRVFGRYWSPWQLKRQRDGEVKGSAQP